MSCSVFSNIIKYYRRKLPKTAVLLKILNAGVPIIVCWKQLFLDEEFAFILISWFLELDWFFSVTWSYFTKRFFFLFPFSNIYKVCQLLWKALYTKADSLKWILTELQLQTMQSSVFSLITPKRNEKLLKFSLQKTIVLIIRYDK